MAFNILDGINHVQRQGQLGQQAGKRQALNRLAGQAYSADPAQRQQIVQQAVGVDAESGFALGETLQADDAQRTKRLVGMARALTKAPEPMRPMLYRQMVPELARFGMQAPPEYSPEIAQTAEQIVQAWGDNEVPEQFTLSPGSARYDANGNLIASQPTAPTPAQLAAVPDGQGGTVQMVFDPRTRTFQQPNYGGQAPSGGGAQVLDDAFINAIMQQESGGNPNAVSPKGARGLMQLMPGTQRDPGFGVVPARDNSPEENVRVGRDYITAMMERYGGDQDLALAAYNYGPGNVDRALQQAGGNKAAAIARMPAETRNYIQQVPERAARMGYTPPKAQTGDESYGQPQTVIGEDGRPRLVQFGNRGGQREVQGYGAAPEGRAATAAEVKEATARRLKRPQISNLERGIANVERAMQALQDNAIGTGPATGRAIGFTREGQALETAVGAMQESLLSLTRVPGIGAQSDLEARIANLKFPNTGNYAENNAMLIENLRMIAQDISAAYDSLQQDDDAIISSRSRAPAAQRPAQQPAAPAAPKRRAYSQGEALQKLASARKAIANGADPEQVRARLREMGLKNIAGVL